MIQYILANFKLFLGNNYTCSKDLVWFTHHNHYPRDRGLSMCFRIIELILYLGFILERKLTVISWLHPICIRTD